MAKILKDAVEGVIKGSAKQAPKKASSVANDLPIFGKDSGLVTDINDPVTKIINREESNRYGAVMGRVNKDMDAYIDRTKRALKEVDPRDTNLIQAMQQSITDAQARKIGRRKDGTYGPIGNDVDTNFYSSYYDENTQKVMDSIQAHKKKNMKIQDEKAKGLTDQQAKAKVEFNTRMSQRETALKENRQIIRENDKIRSGQAELPAGIIRNTTNQIREQIAKGNIPEGNHIVTSTGLPKTTPLNTSVDYSSPDYWEEMIELATRSGNKDDLALASKEYLKTLKKKNERVTQPDIDYDNINKAGKPDTSDKIDVVLGLNKRKKPEVSNILKARGGGGSWASIERGGGMSNKAHKADVLSAQYRDGTIGTRTFTTEKQITNDFINALVDAESKGQPLDDIINEYYAKKSYNAPNAGQVSDSYIASKAKLLEDANAVRDYDKMKGVDSDEGEQLIAKIRNSVEKDMATQGITDKSFIDNVMARIQGNAESLKTTERVNRVNLKTDKARAEFNRLVRTGMLQHTPVLDGVKDIKKFQTNLKRIDTAGDVDKLIKEIDDYAHLNNEQKKRIASYAVRNTMKAHGTDYEGASAPVKGAIDALEEYKKSIDINSKASTELLGRAKGSVNKEKVEAPTYNADTVKNEHKQELQYWKEKLEHIDSPYNDNLYTMDTIKQRELAQQRIKELEEQAKFIESGEPYTTKSRNTNYVQKYRTQLAKDKETAAKQAAKDAKIAAKDKEKADKLLAKSLKAEQKAKLAEQRKASNEKYGGKSWKKESEEKLIKTGIKKEEAPKVDTKAKQTLAKADKEWNTGMLFPDEYLRRIDSAKQAGVLSDSDYNTRRAQIQKAVDKINAMKPKHKK